jgi:hypothetical protein
MDVGPGESARGHAGVAGVLEMRQAGGREARLKLHVLPLQLITGLTCIALLVIALPLVIYLRAHDALDASADVASL